MVAVAGVSLGSNAISVFATRREATSAYIRRKKICWIYSHKNRVDIASL